MTQILTDRILDPRPKARRRLALATTYDPARLEAACLRALAYEDPAYQTVKRILTQGLDEPRAITPEYLPVTATPFARPVADLVGRALQELAPWQ